MQTAHKVTLAIACALGAACGPATSSSSTPSGAASAHLTSVDSDKAVLEMGERVFAAHMERFPEDATGYRLPGAAYDKLADMSLERVRARRAQYDGWLAELRRVDRRALQGDALTVYDAALAELEGELRARPCRDEFSDVSPTGNGWPATFSTFAEVQPVGTDSLRAQALARFGAMPAYIDTEMTNLREGIRLGYVSYAGSVHAVMDLLDALLAEPPERSPLFAPAERDGTPAFRARFLEVVGKGILPAVRRYREFLEREYLPHARKVAGVLAKPDGDACYRGQLRAYTTLDIDPRKVHEIGWAELAKIEAQMKEISAKSFGGEPVRSLLDRFRNDPSYRYRDKQEMLDQANSAIARARAAIPRAFGLSPQSNVIVQPIPAFLEKSYGAHYDAAAIDGSRPAMYSIRLYRPDQQSKVLGESTAFHEVIPGHHLQVDIQTHRPKSPPIARYLYNSGYVEGWGLYAEQLADELGLYSSDADRFGMLSMRAWRALRLIVDSGIHAFGWERQRAIDTMLAHSASSPDQAAAEVDRYIAMPGQACAYMLGYLEIMSLRDEAKWALGARFDLHTFHDRVLENGSVPLPALRSRMEAWIHTESAAAAPPGH
ncbi:MAG TPA: DUF885 domain-containing protein [Polyangiaceae bacterium]|nr:DUF885 domain-containing protein [Polyangiaceae bacterium]